MPRDDLNSASEKLDRLINGITAIAKAELSEPPVSDKQVEEQKFAEKVEETVSVDSEQALCEKCNIPMAARIARRPGIKRRYTMLMGHLFCPQCGHTIRYKRIVY